MKILVCGGRNFDNYLLLRSVLDGYRDNYTLQCIIHGGARGADSLGGEWARANGIQEVLCPANWDKHGKRAGYVRNAAMLYLKPDLVIAFPGGKGTEMMVKLAKESGLEVVNVR